MVVEDEPKMRKGCADDTAADGPQALALSDAAAFDAMVLDVMRPGLDGFAACATLRRRGIWLPVLMLTAKDAVADRVQGLDGGADDYLTKPFNLEELMARLRALIRRGKRTRVAPPVGTPGRRRCRVTRGHLSPVRCCGSLPARRPDITDTTW
jgi:DNA-binding response OmpR family regulator